MTLCLDLIANASFRTTDATTADRDLAPQTRSSRAECEHLARCALTVACSDDSNFAASISSPAVEMYLLASASEGEKYVQRIVASVQSNADGKALPFENVSYLLDLTFDDKPRLRRLQIVRRF